MPKPTELTTVFIIEYQFRDAGSAPTVWNTSVAHVSSSLELATAWIRAHPNYAEHALWWWFVYPEMVDCPDDDYRAHGSLLFDSAGNPISERPR